MRAVLAIAERQPVVYGVNDLSDKTCERLCEAALDDIELVPGVSEGNRLTAFAKEDVRIISASDADVFRADAHVSTLIRELDNQMLAGDVKLKLAESYPDELTIFVSGADGRIKKMQLCDLDRMAEYGHGVCALVPAVRELDQLERYDLRHLEEIMQRLRGFDGDPWDRDQTHASLRKCLVEEAYEVVDAIDRDDMDDLYDELGDLLLQVVFHTDIAKQFGEFELSDVTTAICKKMIRRHPTVFGNAAPGTVSWDELKKQERAQTTQAEALRAVAESMPALMRAAKVWKRSGESPIDATEAWESYRKTPDAHTLGRLLFALGSEASQKQIDPEMSLTQETDRFIRSFEEQEQKARAH